MQRVPRERFVPPSERDFAYDDRPLSIGYGQTISQPFIVAMMVESLNLQQTDKVLEVGSGSGYVAAILGGLAEKVIGVDIV
ncbi:MAG: protein-L-isoaspartate O-methyltransferase, partial [Dehalococcoidia bacterium]